MNAKIFLMQYLSNAGLTPAQPVLFGDLISSGKSATPGPESTILSIHDAVNDEALLSDVQIRFLTEVLHRLKEYHIRCEPFEYILNVATYINSCK